jgi:hypothetical protein
MPENDPILCPVCGERMNRHAEKVDSGAPAETDESLAVWGGGLTAFYACPRCGAIEQRRAGGN